MPALTSSLSLSGLPSPSLPDVYPQGLCFTWPLEAPPRAFLEPQTLNRLYRRCYDRKTGTIPVIMFTEVTARHPAVRMASGDSVPHTQAINVNRSYKLIFKVVITAST